MIFRIFYNKKGKPVYRMVADNNKTLNHSEEYASKRNALKTIQSIIEDIQSGNIKIQIEVK
jgi:uncharacterized protein YegP (UPF0339 family)